MCVVMPWVVTAFRSAALSTFGAACAATVPTISARISTIAVNSLLVIRVLSLLVTDACRRSRDQRRSSSPPAQSAGTQPRHGRARCGAGGLTGGGTPSGRFLQRWLLERDVGPAVAV